MVPLALLLVLAAAPPAPPLVIAHRGASGHLPEHTLEAYALASDVGADFIEPDLVSTKDGHLVARHEPNILATTNVKDHPEFASRRRTVEVDGVPQEGFFTVDFTLAELKTLRAVQAFGERPQQFNGRFTIPSLEDILQLARQKGAARGRPLGVYLETKHPTWHRVLGLPLEERVVAALKRARLNSADAPVFLQSFEPDSLKRLKVLSPVRRIQLVDADDVDLDGVPTFKAPVDRPYDWTVSSDAALRSRTFAFMVTPAGLDEIAAYAQGVGPWKRYVVSTRAQDANQDGQVDDINHDGAINEADRSLLPASTLIQDAHARHLLVHVWTFRNEPRRLPMDHANIPVQELLMFMALGVDGVFDDFPDTAVTARHLHALGPVAR